jgi:hypothetical protein
MVHISEPLETLRQSLISLKLGVRFDDTKLLYLEPVPILLTAGHQSIIRWLSEHYDWVGIWASDNPFKDHQTSLDHRMTYVKIID